jgi:hypothetical protein
MKLVTIRQLKKDEHNFKLLEATKIKLKKLWIKKKSSVLNAKKN